MAAIIPRKGTACNVDGLSMISREILEKARQTRPPHTVRCGGTSFGCEFRIYARWGGPAFGQDLGFNAPLGREIERSGSVYIWPRLADILGDISPPLFPFRIAAKDPQKSGGSWGCQWAPGLARMYHFFAIGAAIAYSASVYIACGSCCPDICETACRPGPHPNSRHWGPGNLEDLGGAAAARIWPGFMIFYFISPRGRGLDRLGSVYGEPRFPEISGDFRSSSKIS